MTSSDGNVKLKESKRESFTGWDWEEIEIKPPIDLIPDEFTRESNDNVLVEIVCSLDDGDAKEFKETLEDLGYSVNETDKDRQRMEKNVDDNWLKAVIKKTEEREYDGLIMIFAKVNYSNEEMKNIWSQFTSKDCPKLKNKPKIFLFQIIKRSPDADYTATSLNWLAPYETPAEADILIVNDRYDPDRRDLLDILSDCIEDCGDKEDIFTLIISGYGHQYQPLVISTMTQKFYFKIHKHRGHHLHIQRRYEEMVRQIDKVKNLLAGKVPSDKVKKKESHLLQSLKKSFSFRKKDYKEEKKTKLKENGSDGPVTKESKEKYKVEMEKTKQIPKTKETEPVKNQEKRGPMNKSPNRQTGNKDSTTRNSTRKPSTASIDSGSRIPRVRTTSTSSDMRGSVTNTKPAWKPR